MSYKSRLVAVLLLAGIVSLVPVLRVTADDGQPVGGSVVEWLIDWGNALWASLTEGLGDPAQAPSSQGSAPEGEATLSASGYIDPRG